MILALIIGAAIGCAAIAWACCFVAGDADRRLDDELDSAFARARYDRTLANHDWESPRNSAPNNAGSSDPTRFKGGDDFNHEGLDK